MIKRLTENFQDDERYEYIKSKTVLDSDGWRTDYTMYYDWEDDKYIFIFGDNDLYDPTNESPDWECDTEAQANDWFDNYTGFDEEEDFDECYLSETNNNTEEQELAEFLDWLKQEKIRVTDVNKKFKMIHIQNPDDLDMASWYLHDRDYFKKLSDFGWMVSAPSPAGRKVAKALKMESTSTGKSYWKYNQFEDTLADGDYYDKYTIKRFRLIPCNTPEECYDGDIKRFSAWAVCESEYPYKEVYCTKDEAYNYLMDFLNNGRYEQIHNL